MSSGLQLNLYSLRPGLDPFCSLLAETGLVAWHAIDEALTVRVLRPDQLDLSQLRPGERLVAYRQGPPREPPWREFIRRMLDASDVLASPSSSDGAVVYTPAQDANGEPQWLAWAFGTGSRGLRQTTTEARFGLKVELNLLVAMEPEIVGDQESIFTALSYRTVVDQPRTTNHRSTRGVSPKAFRMDRLMDVVSSVGGRVVLEGVDAESAVHGGRSLHLRANVGSIDDLHLLGLELQPIALRTDYRERFAWADEFIEVEDPEERRAILHDCAKALLVEPPSYAHPVIDLVLPEELDHSREAGEGSWRIALPSERPPYVRINLNVNILRQWLGSRAILADDTLDVVVRFLLDDQLEFSRTVLDLLVAEHRKAGETYFVEMGRVLKPSTSYLAALDRTLDAIETDLPLAWPDAPLKAENEREFNRTLVEANPHRALLLDGDLLQLPGQSAIEACDILTDDGHFIHVKKWERSSTFSHLCQQALDAAVLVRHDDTARVLLLEKVSRLALCEEDRERFANAVNAAATRSSSARLVVALYETGSKRTVRELPLLARISLMHTQNRAAHLGITLKVCFIDQLAAAQPPELKEEVDLRDRRRASTAIESTGRRHNN